MTSSMHAFRYVGYAAGTFAYTSSFCLIAGISYEYMRREPHMLLKQKGNVTSIHAQSLSGSPFNVSMKHKNVHRLLEDLDDLEDRKEPRWRLKSFVTGVSALGSFNNDALFELEFADANAMKTQSDVIQDFLAACKQSNVSTTIDWTDRLGFKRSKEFVWAELV